MYSFLVLGGCSTDVTDVEARIKPEDDYDFFTYQGKPLTIDSRGKHAEVKKGQRFGVRKSSNGKEIRMVLDDNVNRVFTLDLDTAKQLAKGIK